MSGMMRLAAVAASLSVALSGAASGQQKVDQTTFGTNWVAQAEHGGYYQAVADGTYKKYNLDVRIVPGGPQANNRMLLPVGRIDFYMGGTIQSFSSVQENIPVVTVAAIFQKDPQVLLAHPGQGRDNFLDLKKAGDILVSKEGLASYYQWMKVEFGFKEEQTKPYTFNPAPFIANKGAVQQGYLTSEPYSVEKAAGFKPVVHLLADNGFSAYSTTIETRQELVDKNPDLVKRFVEASITGWYNYIYGDNKAANELIKKDNPEMTDDKLAYSVAKLKEYGIVDSGDTAKLGIGAMTDERFKSFFDKMVKAGLFKPELDYKKSYTLQFVNKGVGLDLKPKN